MNDDHTIRCPACLAEYSRLDSPIEFERVMHVLHPERFAEHLVRLAQEVLADPAKHLPSMSKQEEDELKANLNLAGTANWPPTMELGDLTPEDQKQVSAYIKAQAGWPERPVYTPEFILDQVCLGLRELGVDCRSEGGWVRVYFCDVNKDWHFGPVFPTWIGIGPSHDNWICDVPSSCTDAPRITKAIYAWIKRFDYREYRGPAK